MNKNRVVLGMSGGVDSSVAAYILMQQGYEVVGVTMNLWPHETKDSIENQGGCCSYSAVEDAKRVAQQLGISYYVVDFQKPFRHKVVRYFIHEYLAGRTPNPCIMCNRFIKFNKLLEYAISIGANYIATGHYARIEHDFENNRYLLKKSATSRKDQTYVLYNMTQYQLEHTLMPIGNYTKEQIRYIARDAGLDIANKPDSQEICFVRDNDYARFVEQEAQVKIKPGNFMDTQGNVLGEHRGIIHYTIGQRKGLGLALGKPMYVVDIKPEDNIVVLGEYDEVFSREMLVEDINLISLPKIKDPIRCNVKIRYTAKEAPAILYPLDNEKIKVIFHEPQKAVTPGQAAVFYQDDSVVGGGIISQTRR